MIKREGAKMKLLNLCSVVWCSLAVAIFGCLYDNEALASQTEALPTMQEARGMNDGTVGIVFHYEDLYRQLTDNMKSVLDKGNEIRLVQSIGDNHVQTIYDMLYLKGIDLGIVHSDVLEFMERTQYFPVEKKWIRYLVKLFDEKVVIIANSAYKRIEDLSGRPVNFSKAGKGRYITGTLLFDTLGINAEPLEINKKVALKKVKSGEIAAMVYLIEEMVPEFHGLTADDNVRLLAIPQTKKLLKIYNPTELTHEDFPNLIPEGESTPSIAVGVMLASYNWPPDNWRHEKVARFVEAFVSKFEEFKNPRYHPAWKNVSLMTEVPRWSRLPVMDILVQEKIAFLEEKQAAQKQQDTTDLEEVKARLTDELAKTENPDEFLEGFLEYLRERQGEAVKKPKAVKKPAAHVSRTSKASVNVGKDQSQVKKAPPSKPEKSKEKIVFVSSVMVPPDMGGLAGGDAKCNALAKSANLPGTYVAWLSDSSTSARERLTPGAGPFVRVDGIVIAEDIPDLLDGNITNPISITEKGKPFQPMVWTGTDASGTGENGFYCADWSMSSTAVKAIYGKAGRVDKSWTDIGTRNINCSVSPDSSVTISIYCFQR